MTNWARGNVLKALGTRESRGDFRVLTPGEAARARQDKRQVLNTALNADGEEAPPKLLRRRRRLRINSQGYDPRENNGPNGEPGLLKQG